MAHPGTSLVLADSWFTNLMFGPRKPGGALGGVGHADYAGQVEWLYYMIFWVSLISFVVLMVLMVYFTLKYRRRPGVAIERSASHNTPLELVWSVGPLLIMTWIFFEGFWGFANAHMPAGGAEEMQLRAQKWNWSLTYPNGAESPETTRVGATDVPVFVMPADHPVLLKMTSADVLHCFWIVDFRFKQDVFPNRYSNYFFRTPPITDADDLHLPDPDKKGPFHEGEYRYRDHYVFCAEYCGDLHSEMAAVIRVVSRDVYRRIVEDWTTPKGPPAERGKVLAKTKGCVTCHTDDGRAGTGPTWKNLYGYEFDYTNGSRLAVDDQHLRESIMMPAVKVRQGFSPQMPVTELTGEQIDWLIAHIKTLSDKAPTTLLEGGQGDAAGDGAGPANNPAGGDPPQ